MNQTSWIAGGIFVGFLVYITIKGELGSYKDAILGTTQFTSADAASAGIEAGLSSVLGSL